MKRTINQSKKSESGKRDDIELRTHVKTRLGGKKHKNGIIVFDSGDLSAKSGDTRNPYNLEMSVLHQISKVIVRRKNVSLLLNEVMEILFREMGLLRGTITLRQGALLVIEASHGLSDSAKQRGVYRMGEGITGRVAKSGKSMIVPDISRCDEFLNRTRARDASKSTTAFLCVPIVYAGEVIGTMSIDREVSANCDLERDLHLLETIANILADAVSGLYLYHEERDKLIAENKTLRLRLDEKLRPKDIVGNCGRMQRVFELIAHASSNDAPVLISGEPGTGKELAARALASSGIYEGKPFREISCAAFSQSRLEDEIFGRQKGFINGLETVEREGLLEQLTGGTLILDAVGELDLPFEAVPADLAYLLAAGEIHGAHIFLDFLGDDCIGNRIVSAFHRGPLSVRVELHLGAVGVGHLVFAAHIFAVFDGECELKVSEMPGQEFLRRLGQLVEVDRTVVVGFRRGDSEKQHECRDDGLFHDLLDFDCCQLLYKVLSVVDVEESEVRPEGQFHAVVQLEFVAFPASFDFGHS